MKFFAWLKSLFTPATPARPPAVVTPIQQPTPEPVQPRLQDKVNVALSITGVFEGEGYGAVSGNFDGMGISVGILQWNYGTSSLQEKLLRPFLAKHGPIEGFPSPGVDTSAGLSSAAGVVYAVHHMLVPGTTKMKPEWYAAWRKWLTDPRVVAIQQSNCLNVGLRAEKICKELGLNPDGKRAFCWAFDIVTQNGSMKGIGLAKPDRKEAADIISWRGEKSMMLWQQMLPQCSDEQVSLLITSHKRALEANPRWYQDVFSRKATIAMGKGVVHGNMIDLAKVFA